jgi:hypothetical protein
MRISFERGCYDAVDFAQIGDRQVPFAEGCKDIVVVLDKSDIARLLTQGPVTLNVTAPTPGADEDPALPPEQVVISVQVTGPKLS